MPSRWWLAPVVLLACSRLGDEHRDNAILSGAGAGAGAGAAAEFSLRFHGDALELQLLSEKGTLLRLPADALALGAVDAVDDATNYDPAPSGTPLSAPQGLRWLSLTDASLVAAPSATSFD